jgi:outer membrane protein TolC
MPRTLTLLCVVALLVGTSPSRAQPLSARQAVRLALSQSPELGPERVSVRHTSWIAGRADKDTSLAPIVGLGAGVRRDPRGEPRPEVSLTVSQPVRLASVAEGRLIHARAIAELARATQARAELDVSLQALSDWLELRRWERVEQRRRSAVERAEQLRSIVLAQVAVGAAQPGDDALAQASLGRQGALLLQAQVERESANAALRLLLAAEPTAQFTTDGELDLVDTASVRPHPAASALWAQARSETAAANMQLLEARLPLSVGLSATREGTGEWLVVGQISLPLPLRNTAAYAAAQTSRNVGSMEFEAEHVAERAARRAQALRGQLSAQRRIALQVQQDEVAPSRRALSVMDHQFHAGKVTLQALLVSRERVAEAELHLLEAQHQLALTRVQIAWLEGSLVRWARGKL